MHLRLSDYVLWFASPVLQVGVLISLFRRGLHRDYPYFFNYTVLGVVSVLNPFSKRVHVLNRAGIAAHPGDVEELLLRGNAILQQAR